MKLFSLVLILSLSFFSRAHCGSCGIEDKGHDEATCTEADCDKSEDSSHEEGSSSADKPSEDSKKK